MLVWEDGETPARALIQAVKCPINPGIPDQHGPLEAYIYVDNIFASVVGKQMMLRLLAAIIEAIFTVCGCAMIEHRQCPLSIKKWNKLVVGPVQTVLGLTVDTNRMKVSIMPKYCQQVADLHTNNWPDTRRIFKVQDIQKLVGKIARLGEGAQWIYKIIRATEGVRAYP